MDWNIAGHKQQLELLEKVMNNGRLAHAYVFAGAEGVGKRTVAKRLAQSLLNQNAPSLSDFVSTASDISPKGGEKDEGYFHPDFLEISGEDGIKIEQIRELTYKLSLLPYQAKYKVAVIDNADQMTTEAANAMLKVLEEPKAYTYIILITSNPTRLPKTILSRCQKLNFGPVEFSEYENLLPNKLSKEKQKLIDTIAAGKPGIALKVANDEVFLEELDLVEQYFDIFVNGKLTDRLVAAYEIADFENIEIKNLLDGLILKLMHTLRQQPDQKLVRKIQGLSNSRRFLDQNVNTKLVLTNLMLNI